MHLARSLFRSLAAAIVVMAAGSTVLAAPLTFGVMADTQWTGVDPTGNNINSVAVNQARACNAQFVAAGVSFVIQVGDLGDNGSNASLQTRLDCNSALVSAGIPFYGLRGNHEASGTAKTFFNANYIPGSTADRPVVVGPDTSSYAVTVGGVKVVLLDIDSTSGSTTALDSATTWMSTQLGLADHTQAFVFQHKNMLGQNHKDNMFGSSNDANPTQQNNFISALHDNGVRYDMSGHDHIHHRSQVVAPSGTCSVQEIICASDSYKYYTPGTPYSSRETVVAQQLYETGYYLLTVDGPRVTGKYYHTTPLANGDIPSNPVWHLGETFGYSLNGKEFMVASGAGLGSVQDTFGLTSMRLGGTNGSAVATYDGRLVTKAINTGWTDKTAGFASDMLTIWGMEDIDAAATASAFSLTLSYTVPTGFAGTIAIEQQNDDGSWAVLPSIVNGDGTVTATGLTKDGNFAVVPEPATMVLLALGGIGALIRRNRK